MSIHCSLSLFSVFQLSHQAHRYILFPYIAVGARTRRGTGRSLRRNMWTIIVNNTNIKYNQLPYITGTFRAARSDHQMFSARSRSPSTAQPVCNWEVLR